MMKQVPAKPGRRCLLILLCAVLIPFGSAGFAEKVPEGAAKPPSRGEWVAPDQVEAQERAKEVVPFVETVMDECLLCRQLKLRNMELGVEDMDHSYFYLDSPIIKKREDHYGGVRFMHAKHAASLKDCALCHHYRPTDPEAKETVRCSACHQEAFKESHPERLGLKAAYHQRCMECHKDMGQGPADCTGCHKKNVPEHKDLVALKPDPKPWEVTEECLRCHDEAGDDMIKTSHWLWRGHSPYTLEHRKEVLHGKATTAVNNF